MKRMLSILLTLVLLVSSLVIPMTISAEDVFDAATHITSIKTAAGNLVMEDAAAYEMYLPLLSRENSSWTKLNAETDVQITLDGGKTVDCGKIVKVPCGVTVSSVWSLPSTVDGIVTLQIPAATGTGHYGNTEIGNLADSFFYVKTNTDLRVEFSIHTGSATKHATGTTAISGGDAWQKVAFPSYSDFNVDATTFVGTIAVSFQDADDSANGFAEGDEIYMGSMYTKYTAPEVSAVADAEDLTDIIYLAEKIDTADYTEASVTALKAAITAAKTAYIKANKDSVENILTLVNKELKNVSKTEVVAVANIGVQHTVSNGSYSYTTSSTGWITDNAQSGGYAGRDTVNSYQSFVDVNEGWRFINKTQPYIRFVSAQLTEAEASSHLTKYPITPADYDELYMYVVEGTNVAYNTKATTSRLGLGQFAAKNEGTWPGSADTDYALTQVATILPNIDKGVKTKLTLWCKDNSFDAIGHETFTNIQVYNNSNKANADPYEVAFSPVYGVKRIDQIESADTNAAIVAVLDAIDGAEWGNVDYIKETSDIIKFGGDYADLAQMLADSLANAGKTEVVWKPRWQHISSTTELTESHTYAGLSAEETAALGGFYQVVSQPASTQVIVALNDDAATTRQDATTNPIAKNKYDKLYLTIINKGTGNYTANAFLLVGGGGNPYFKDQTFEPGINTYEINSSVTTLDGNPTFADSTLTNYGRIQIQIQNISGDIIVGSLLGFKKVDTTELLAADSALDIINFMENKIIDKGIEGTDEAVALYNEMKEFGALELTDTDKVELLKAYWLEVESLPRTVMVPVALSNSTAPEVTDSAEKAIYGERYVEINKSYGDDDKTNYIRYYDAKMEAEGTAGPANGISFKFSDYDEIYIPYDADSAVTLNVAQWTNNAATAVYNSKALTSGEKNKFDLRAAFKYGDGTTYSNEAIDKIFDGETLLPLKETDPETGDTTWTGEYLYQPGELTLGVATDFDCTATPLKLGSVMGVKKITADFPELFDEEGTFKEGVTAEKLVYATALLEGELKDYYTNTENLLAFATPENFPNLKVEGFKFNSAYVVTKDGSAVYDKDGNTVTAVQLAPSYVSPRLDTAGNFFDSTKVVLDGGVEAELVERNIYFATKATADEMGEDFGKGTYDKDSKVRVTTTTGENLTKYWDSEKIDENTGTTYYALKYADIAQKNINTALAMRAKIVFKVGTREFTAYTDIRNTLTNGGDITVQSLYDLLENKPDWFTAE